MGKTLIIIKPDAVSRGLIGCIITRFENAGFAVKYLKWHHMTKEFASVLYQEHQNRPGFSDYMEFMSSGPVVVMVLEGVDAVNKAREMIGSWDPAKAKSGSIRGDFGIPDGRGILNIVHASDTLAEVEREMTLLLGMDKEKFGI